MPARAQDPGGAWLAQTWTSEDGLPATEILALLQSREGFLWIGTPNGLARFDGDRFITLRKSDAPGLTSNHVLSLANARAGGLWIATHGGGLTHFNPDGSELTPRAQGLSSLTVLAVREDDRGQLWVGSDTGLNRWELNRFISYLKVDGLPDEAVTALVQAPSGDLLVGTGAGLVYVTEGRIRPFTPVPGLSTSRISALEVDRTGRVWIGTDTGLYLQEPDQGGIRKLRDGKIRSILSRKNGEVWVGTADGQLNRFTDSATASLPVHRFTSPVAALLEDREGNVWAGTGEGLTRFRPRQLFFAETAAPGQDLISCYSPRTGVAARVFRNGEADLLSGGVATNLGWFPATVLARAVDGADGALWIATSGEGLFRWHEQSLRVWSQREGLSDIFVETLHATGADSVWVGTRNGGLNYVTSSSVRRFLTPWGYTGNYASTIASHSNGTVWIGTTGDGVFRLKEGRFTGFNSASGLPDDHVRCLIVEEDETVWAATGRGLAFWNGSSWHTFTSRNGIPEEGIDQMQDDRAGNLWLGSGSTLVRVEKRQLRSVAAARQVAADAVPFGRGDGLAGMAMIQGAQVSRNTTKDQIVFLTTRGLLYLEHGTYQFNTNLPPVLLEQVLVGSEPVPVAQRIEIPAGQRTLQFRFTALSFSAPEKVRFRCRLIGFDPEWVELGASRTMRYTQVPAGQYTFQVIACNNDGVWNEEGTRVLLVLTPFWWETLWFRLGAAFSLASVLAGGIYLRRQRRSEMERLRLRIAGDLHDEIGSSLWSISLLSKMLHQAKSLSEEDRRDASDIHRIATHTSNALRDIVWLINPGLDTLQDMVLRMRDFLAATARGLEVQVQAEGANLARKLSLEMRQSFFLVFKEAVTNATKHAQARKLNVVICEMRGDLEMRIRDDGIGFDPTRKSRGHGLPSLRRRAETVKGQLMIQSRPGEGTEILLRAPL